MTDDLRALSDAARRIEDELLERSHTGPFLSAERYVTQKDIIAVLRALAASPSPATEGHKADCGCPCHLRMSPPCRDCASPSPATDRWKEGYRAGYLDGERGSDPAVANVDEPSPATDAGLDGFIAETFASLRRRLVGTPPNVDSIDAAIGYALNDCEAAIKAALR